MLDAFNEKFIISFENQGCRVKNLLTKLEVCTKKPPILPLALCVSVWVFGPAIGCNFHPIVIKFDIQNSKDRFLGQ